jgi:1-acyl-sn-glycerol-3-phosphate acyltransferase
VLILKGLRFAAELVYYVFMSSLGRFFARTPIQKRAYSLQRDVLTARRLLKSLEVRVTTLNSPEPRSSGRSRLFVANHLSDVDILALASTTPMVFIASVEVREQPLVGLWAELGGCVFVERRNRFSVKSEIAQMTRLLRDGFDLALFAEGTTTNGENVLPFKNTLIQAAINAEAELVPVCINYLSIDGEQPSPANRDNVFFYGNMSFASHVGRLLRTPSIEMECHFLDPIPLTRHDDRKDIAQRAHRAISENYVPITGRIADVAEQFKIRHTLVTSKN